MTTATTNRNEQKKETASVKRIDWGKVLVLGQSGYGKTYMFRNCKGDNFGMINAERKPLPYKASLKYHGKPTSWAGFMQNLGDYVKNPEITMIGIDSQSMAFDMLYEECLRNYKGYDVYSGFNRQVISFFNLLRDAEKDIIVTGHDEILMIEGFKQRRAKIHGKTYEGRVEAYYTTVLFADRGMVEGKPWYKLKTMVPDTSSKAPPDLFGEGKSEIENDAEVIFEKLKEFYS